MIYRQTWCKFIYYNLFLQAANSMSKMQEFIFYFIYINYLQQLFFEATILNATYSIYENITKVDNLCIESVYM